MGYRDYGYIFLVTYGRSGSTLIQSLLNHLPGFQIRGENNNALYHAHHLIDSIALASEMHGRGSTAFNAPWYGADLLDPPVFRDAVLDLFMNTVLQPAPDAKVIGFKEIRFSRYFMNDAQFRRYMDFLLDTFPDARIVFNSRSWEEVSRSGYMRESTPATVRSMVETCDARFEAYDADNERTLHINYGEYTRDRTQLKALFAFVGARYDADLVDRVMSKKLTHAQKRYGSKKKAPNHS